MSLKRRIIDFLAGRAMFVTTLFSGMLVVIIAVALYARSWPLIESKSLSAIIFGSTWKPSAGEFGLMPFIIGTAWVTVVAAIIAVPLCILAAIYLAEYAAPRTRSVLKPLIDLLAGIPSVVYGAWAALVIVPLIADHLGPYAQAHLKHIPLLSAEYVTGYSVLAGGIVLAVMICPVIISVAEEVLRAVPQDFRDASYAVGATRLETITKVVIRRASKGLLAAVVLGISRALGETMAVLMVVGNVAALPKSIFDPAYPLPALIANNYGEMMSIPLYDSALLCAALVLLVIVLFFNVAARLVLVRGVTR